jgi:hypothetical protein
MIDRERPTLLVDEADNQDLSNNPTLRSVFNSGHHYQGKIWRCLDGEIRDFLDVRAGGIGRHRQTAAPDHAPFHHY